MNVLISKEERVIFLGFKFYIIYRKEKFKKRHIKNQFFILVDYKFHHIHYDLSCFEFASRRVLLFVFA